MKRKHQAAAGALIATGLLLMATGCGGGGGGGGVAATVKSFTETVLEMARISSETTEPVDLASLTEDASETAEPVAVQ